MFHLVFPVDFYFSSRLWVKREVKISIQRQSFTKGGTEGERGASAGAPVGQVAAAWENTGEVSCWEHPRLQGSNFVVLLGDVLRVLWGTKEPGDHTCADHESDRAAHRAVLSTQTAWLSHRVFAFSYFNPKPWARRSRYLSVFGSLRRHQPRTFGL